MKYLYIYDIYCYQYFKSSCWIKEDYSEIDDKKPFYLKLLTTLERRLTIRWFRTETEYDWIILTNIDLTVKKMWALEII